jgi:cell division protein FtsX
MRSKRPSRRLPNVNSVQLDTEWVKRLVALLDLLRSFVLLTADCSASACC